MSEIKLTEHEAETVEAVAEVHAAHGRKSTLLDRSVDTLTSTFGRSMSVLVVLVIVVLWIFYNLYGGAIGPAFDPPPFAALELTATLFALFLAALILATQRRADRLAEQRAQLTLQVSLLNDRKSAKIISLLEELRRDMPTVEDRDDEVSEALARVADPTSVLSAIEERTPTFAKS